MSTLPPSPQPSGLRLRQRLTWLRHAVLRALPRSAQAAVILRTLAPAATPPADVEVVLAETPAHLQAAAHLTFEAYTARGLVDGRGVPVRVTPYLLLPSTLVFVALRAGEVIGTMSLVTDSALGLPLEAVAAPEVARLRAAGRRLAEVGALAVRKGERGLGLPMLLYKAMWTMAARQGVQDLLIAIHPDAEPLYRVPLCFERLGAVTGAYPGLEKAAVAVTLRLALDVAPATFRQAFAGLPRTRFNPATYFIDQVHPQLRLPETASELELAKERHALASLRLAALRPDMLVAQDDETFDTFRRAMAPTGQSCRAFTPTERPAEPNSAVATSGGQFA